jgi:hypothetical protein
MCLTIPTGTININSLCILFNVLFEFCIDFTVVLDQFFFSSVFMYSFSNCVMCSPWLNVNCCVTCVRKLPKFSKKMPKKLHRFVFCSFFLSFTMLTQRTRLERSYQVCHIKPEEVPPYIWRPNHHNIDGFPFSNWPLLYIYIYIYIFFSF